MKGKPNSRFGLSHLFLLRELVKRDLQSRYAGSFFGFLWSFAQPLWQLLLYSFVFSTVLKVSLLGERTDRFWVFLFAGLLPWMAIQEGVMRGATCITDSAPLVKKLRFPSQLLVWSVVLAALAQEAVAALVFAVILGVLGDLSFGSLVWLLPAVAIQVALTVGLAHLLAALHVYFRDVAQALGLLLSAWFFLTPIVYPMSLVPERYLSFLQLNPLLALVGLYRAAFLGGPVPVDGLLATSSVSVVLLFVGVFTFGRLRPGFADEI